MINLKRKPTHPGEILREEFLIPLGITQSQLASDLETTFRTINELTNEKRNISSEMAIKLSKYFGTSIDLWLNLQNQCDVYNTYQKNRSKLNRIKKFQRKITNST